MKNPEINLYYCTSCGTVQVKNETLEQGEDSFTSICQVCNKAPTKFKPIALDRRFGWLVFVTRILG